jgi:hypothetical protein
VPFLYIGSRCIALNKCTSFERVYNKYGMSQGFNGDMILHGRNMYALVLAKKVEDMGL